MNKDYYLSIISDFRNEKHVFCLNLMLIGWIDQHNLRSIKKAPPASFNEGVLSLSRPVKKLGTPSNIRVPSVVSNIL